MPEIWQKIQKIGGDISPASLAFWMYAGSIQLMNHELLFYIPPRDQSNSNPSIHSQFPVSRLIVVLDNHPSQP